MPATDESGSVGLPTLRTRSERFALRPLGFRIFPSLSLLYVAGILERGLQVLFVMPTRRA